MTQLKLDIVSDIACPWCAIGYARLEKAMAELKGDIDFTLQWHAFELNPDPNAEPEPILPALARKYGRPVTIATDLGLNFEKMQQRYTRNTFDAHRLVKWAESQGKQTAMKLACFDAYFGDAADIADPDVLAGCAEKAGLDSDQAKAILASDDYADAVRQDEAKYQQAGVSAVPAFIVNDTYLISGAQEPETLVQAFEEIAEKA